MSKYRTTTTGFFIPRSAGLLMVVLRSFGWCVVTQKTARRRLVVARGGDVGLNRKFHGRSPFVVVGVSRLDETHSTRLIM